MPDTLKEYDQLIKKGFEARYEHDTKLKSLKETYLDPEQKLKKEDWDNLAVDTGIEKTDLGIDYKKYARERDTEKMDEEERDRIQDNRRIIHHALAKGKMGNLFDTEVIDFVPKRLQQASDMADAEAGEEADEAAAA